MDWKKLEKTHEEFNRKAQEIDAETRCIEGYVEFRDSTRKLYTYTTLVIIIVVGLVLAVVWWK